MIQWCHCIPQQFLRLPLDSEFCNRINDINRLQQSRNVQGFNETKEHEIPNFAAPSANSMNSSVVEAAFAARNFSPDS